MCRCPVSRASCSSTTCSAPWPSHDCRLGCQPPLSTERGEVTGSGLMAAVALHTNTPGLQLHYPVKRRVVFGMICAALFACLCTARGSLTCAAAEGWACHACVVDVSSHAVLQPDFCTVPCALRWCCVGLARVLVEVPGLLLRLCSTSSLPWTHSNSTWWQSTR